MIKLSWKLNGRTVAPKDLATEFAKDVKKRALQAGAEHLLAVRCPVHGRGATMKSMKEKSDREAGLTLDICCDKLDAEIRRALA